MANKQINISNANSKKDTSSTSWLNDFSKVMNSYEFEILLPFLNKKIKFKPIDIRTLKKMTLLESSDDIRGMELMFDEVLKNSITDPLDFDIETLPFFDRLLLIIELRKASKGKSVQQIMRCPKCNQDSMQNISFDDMEFIDYKDNGMGIIELNQNAKIKFGHVTRRDQKEALDKVFEEFPDIDNDKKTAMSSLYFTAAMIKSYVDTQGNEHQISTLNEKIEIMNHLSDNTLDYIKKWLKDNMYGYNISYKLKCPHCGYIDNSTDNLD